MKINTQNKIVRTGLSKIIHPCYAQDFVEYGLSIQWKTNSIFSLNLLNVKILKINYNAFSKDNLYILYIAQFHSLNILFYNFELYLKLINYAVIFQLTYFFT